MRIEPSLAREGSGFILSTCPATGIAPKIRSLLFRGPRPHGGLRSRTARSSRNLHLFSKAVEATAMVSSRDRLSQGPGSGQVTDSADTYGRHRMPVDRMGRPWKHRRPEDGCPRLNHRAKAHVVRTAVSRALVPLGVSRDGWPRPNRDQAPVSRGRAVHWRGRPFRFPHRRRDLRSLRGKRVQDAFRGALLCQGVRKSSLPGKARGFRGVRTPSKATPASIPSWRRSTNGSRKTRTPTVAA